MSDTQQLPLSIQPVISYPREAQVGKTYLMTIDLQPFGDSEWLYEDEEYPIYCMLETSPLFSSKPVGEPAVVLHRFGGSYGAAQFLLTASQEEIEGQIRITLVNGWGMPIRVLNLSNIKIIQKNTNFSKPLTFDIKVHSNRTNQEDLVISPDFNLTKYQEGLRERYSNLNLSSLDPTGCTYNQLKLWQVFIPQNVRQVNQIVPQVCELPKEDQRRLRESNQLNADVSLEKLTEYKQVYSQHPISPINEIINDKDNYRYLVILGDPGSGKSTLLQYLALDWAKSTPNDASLKPIPLLIELRTYMRNRDAGQCKNFLEFFHDSSGIVCHLNQRQLVEQLKSGNALVMFDGLDEVFDPGKREDVITDIHRFTNDYPDVRVIVTSRVIGYKPQRLRDAQFHHFMLQDLEESQIQEFINRTTWRDDSDTLLWLKNCTQSEDNPTLRQAAVEELAKAWKNDPDILSILKQRAQSDDDSDVRIAALQGLAQGWKDDFDILLIFHTIVESDKDLDVRQAALRELAHHWKDDPDTLLLLKECIQSDEDPDLRQTALQELLQGWEYNAVIDLISDIKTFIESAIDSDLNDTLQGKTVESTQIPDDNNEATVLDVGEAKEIILNVEQLKINSNYKFIIPFKLKVECLLTYFIFKADYYTLDESQMESISIDDWNDHDYEAEEYYLLEVEGLVSVNIVEDEDIAIDSLTRIDVVE